VPKITTEPDFGSLPQRISLDLEIFGLSDPVSSDRAESDPANPERSICQLYLLRRSIETLQKL
jgi:hypothetical protein